MRNDYTYTVLYVNYISNKLEEKNKKLLVQAI